jgi:hypothetical protein
MAIEDWSVVPVLSVFKDQFSYRVCISGQRGVHHDQDMTIYIGVDEKLYIKAGGDWDYQWVLDPNKNIHSYDLLKFLLLGSSSPARENE